MSSIIFVTLISKWFIQQLLSNSFVKVFCGWMDKYKFCSYTDPVVLSYKELKQLQHFYVFFFYLFSIFYYIKIGYFFSPAALWHSIDVNYLLTGKIFQIFHLRAYLLLPKTMLIWIAGNRKKICQYLHGYGYIGNESVCYTVNLEILVKMADSWAKTHYLNDKLICYRQYYSFT